jgi:hypothetical protein
MAVNPRDARNDQTGELDAKHIQFTPFRGFERFPFERRFERFPFERRFERFPFERRFERFPFR